ncbi:hypothetical protein AC578_9956 [Pseudocercospora eumusae]|uniref:Uncharacterized protein n=1 Tax=Pseudocercospora eumusae TaxID=321146 RepID=A0A139H0F0_9PEZI|nr:hypothetical protein AC578_9956 [Pseudocercospora eumusae]
MGDPDLIAQRIVHLSSCFSHYPTSSVDMTCPEYPGADKCTTTAPALTLSKRELINPDHFEGTSGKKRRLDD